MEKQDKKRFKEPGEYIREIIFYSIVCIVVLILIIDFSMTSEEELYTLFANQKLTGDASNRRGQVLQMFIMKNFGKTGTIIFGAILFLLFIDKVYTEWSAYRRYKRKCRIYQDGLIKNFYDIYDDYAPPPLWKRIRNLFKKKNKYKRRKY